MFGPDPVPPRRLLSLIKGLGPGSALHRAADPKGWGWTQTDELLASLIEVIDLSNRLFIQAHSKKGTRTPKPLHVPRPTDTGPRPIGDLLKLVKHG